MPLPSPTGAAVSARDATMSLVNLAARQRMLSQRMVLQTVLAARGSDLHLKAARHTLALFKDSQAQLVDTPRLLEPASAERIRAVMEREPTRLRAALTAADEQARTVVEATAALRSSSIDRLHRMYAGDLENIVVRALEKDPSRRYPTAAALAEDLQRYRRHEPVLARTPSPGYRLGKFVRRNRVVVGAGVVAILTLVAATIITSTQMVSAREQRDLARAERDSRARVTFADRLVRRNLTWPGSGTRWGAEGRARPASRNAPARTVALGER